MRLRRLLFYWVLSFIILLSLFVYRMIPSNFLSNYNVILVALLTAELLLWESVEIRSS